MFTCQVVTCVITLKKGKEGTGTENDGTWLRAYLGVGRWFEKV